MTSVGVPPTPAGIQEGPAANTAAQLRSIYKGFFGVVANNDVDLDLQWGEVHALLGENGAGKSTLCSVLSGLYRPDMGMISVDGKVVEFRSPHDALAAGIGMVYQHFRLVDRFTVAENLVLGHPDTKLLLPRTRIEQEVEEYVEKYAAELAGQDPARLPYDPAAPLALQVGQSFAMSQRHLGSEHIDALLLHSPLRSRDDLRDVWRAMEALVDTGAVALIRISNCYDPALLQALCHDARIKPAIMQHRFHAATGYDTGIRAFCRAEGLVYQSFWTLSANPRLLGSATLLALAAAHARTPAQILFRYLIQRGVVPLTGTTSLDHLRESLAVFDFALDARDAADIDATLRESTG